MRTNTEQIKLLAACNVPSVKWNVIARAAQRGDLDRLLAGEIVEKRGKDAKSTADAIKRAQPEFAQYLDRAREAIRIGESAGAKLTTALPDDDVYPINLRVIFNLPPFLFYRGELKREDARSVAVVGTRQASEEGLAAASRMAKKLVSQNVSVLSGLAKGIDAAAHRASIEAGGRTIAVVGTGITRTYPKEHAELAEQVVSSGALVSQFWPDASPARYSFPMRNVVMSGMSQGTVVIEAGATSGAKMQARLALEHNKQAFLVQSLVTSQEWARTYLGRGAVEVAHVEDVVNQLRPTDQIERMSSHRRQLTFELA